MKKAAILVGAAVGLAGMVLSETVTNNLDVQGGFIYNHGVVNPGDIGMTFTNKGIRDITVSAGQLSGVDPETGAVITNAANLLSLKAESLATVSNVTAGGKFVGDGSGLTNLNASSFSGSFNASSLPTSGVWHATGVSITNATLIGQTSIGHLTVTSNLVVSGTLAGMLNMGGNSISNAGSMYVTGNINVSNAVVAKQFRVSNSSIGSYSESSTILGGSGNVISNNVYNSAIVSGVDNEIASGSSFIGSGLENKALDYYTVVGGGRYNRATNEYAFIGGGRANHAYGLYSVIGGGKENKALAVESSVSGGYRNEVTEDADCGFIGGGYYNTVNGYAATVAGGEFNFAEGTYSFAGGRKAEALHNGSFVWADSSDSVFQSVTSNEFAIYAQGGLRLVGGVFIGDGSGLTNIADGASAEETDPVFTVSAAASINSSDLSEWSTAYSWGNHSVAGYATGTPVYIESDPAFAASVAAGITTNDIATWNAGGQEGGLLRDGSLAMTGNLNMGQHSITNISSYSLVYEDGQTVQEKYVDISGDTLTGILILQTNLLCHGQVIIGSAEFTEQSISNEVADTVIVEGDVQVSGTYYGDGSELTQLNATSIVGVIPANNLPPEALLFNSAVATNVLWGHISGTLSAQTDLSNALAGKLDMAWTNTLELGTMAGAETNDYISTVQFIAGTSNFVDHSAATNIFSGELVAQANLTVQGALTALYVPPQGDLLMGSYTNGLPQ